MRKTNKTSKKRETASPAHIKVLCKGRAILKENSKTVSGFHFLEGPILGEHYFERNNGVSLDENLNERVFFI